MILLLAATVAFAQEQMCEGPYAADQWAADLEAVDVALGSVDLDTARASLQKAHRGSVCLTEVARPSQIGRMARQLALVFFFDQDEDAMVRWHRAALDAWPDQPWPSDMGPDHPMRSTLEGYEQPGPAGPPGKGLVPPPKGVIFRNGAPLLVAQAPVEVPGLVQLVDKDGKVIESFWQDGSAFPDRLLGPAKKLEAPKGWTPEPAAGRVAMKSPLFGGEAPAVVEAPPAVEAPVVAVAPAPAPAPVAPTQTKPGGYVDPFTEAKLRAVSRELSSRSETVATGETRTVTTEVVTFVEDKGSPGPVTRGDFATWLQYHPQFAKEAAIAGGFADGGYLTDLGEDPKGAIRWVSFAIAKQFCDTWGGGLADAEIAVPVLTSVEWRQQGGAPAQRFPDGRVELWTGSQSTSSGDVAFRCMR